jgi:hypothetical protein
MKTADIFIIKSLNDSGNSNNLDCDYHNAKDIMKQSEDLKLTCSISEPEYYNIPRKTDASLVIFLYQNTLIRPDYLSKIVSLKVLNPNASAFFGKTNVRVNRCDQSIMDFYQYMYSDLSTQNILSYKLQSDDWPMHLNGLVVDGRTYNSIGGYIPNKIKNNYFQYNHSFFKALKGSGDFIYAGQLETVVNINNSIGYNKACEDLGLQFFIRGKNEEVFKETHKSIYDNNFFQYGIFTGKTNGAFLP